MWCIWLELVALLLPMLFTPNVPCSKKQELDLRALLVDYMRGSNSCYLLPMCPAGTSRSLMCERCWLTTCMAGTSGASYFPSSVEHSQGVCSTASSLPRTMCEWSYQYLLLHIECEAQPRSVLYRIITPTDNVWVALAICNGMCGWLMVILKSFCCPLSEKHS